MPNLTAIVLAAGRSSRMDNVNKLLLPLGEKTILESVVDKVCASSVSDVVVVTGHEDRQIRDVLAGYQVRVAYNPEFAGGISTSIRRGILACRPETEGYMMYLADMPFIRQGTLEQLREVFQAQDEPSIVVATMNGRHGHPVVLHAEYREQLLQLQGDVGARSIVAENPGSVIEVEVNDDGIFHDIDTRAAYNEVRVK
jgi:molybdenum cofactor cytidylyltransferase